MLKHARSAAVTAVVGCVAVGAVAAPGPQPGDVFKEFTWRPEGKWQRVTWPQVEEPGARRFLPNAVNKVAIGDLDNAARAEACVELLLCHGGTVDKKMRVNGGDWIGIPESDLIPGDAGQGGPPTEYQSMRVPCADIPLAQLRKGENTFEFSCGPGTGLGKRWPQWLCYGVTFRVYYRPDGPRPTGRIVSPAPGAILSDMPVLEAEASSPEGVARVDFIGLYEDFNWEGDGQWRQWRRRYLYGEMHSHIGVTTQTPFQVTWDTSWVPTQGEAMSLMARVVDNAGVCYMTEAVEGLRLASPTQSGCSSPMTFRSAGRPARGGPRAARRTWPTIFPKRPRRRS